MIMMVTISVISMIVKTYVNIYSSTLKNIPLLFKYLDKRKASIETFLNEI